jgi:hypothetical protein
MNWKNTISTVSVALFIALMALSAMSGNAMAVDGANQTQVDNYNESVTYYAVYGNSSGGISTQEAVMVSNLSEAFNQSLSDGYAGNETKYVVEHANKSNYTITVNSSYSVEENNSLLVSGETTNITFDPETNSGKVFAGNGSESLMIGPNVTIQNNVLFGGGSGSSGDSGIIAQLTNNMEIPMWGIFAIAIAAIVVFVYVWDDVSETMEEEL